MKIFNDLHVDDVFYIITELDRVIICRVTKLFKMTDAHGNCTMTVTYTYADKRTKRDMEFEFKVNMLMMDDFSELMIFRNKSMMSYTIFLNRDDVMNEINRRIEILKNQRDNVNNFCKNI